MFLGETFIKVELNNVKWMIKFVQKWYLTHPLIGHGRIGTHRVFYNVRHYVIQNNPVKKTHTLCAQSFFEKRGHKSIFKRREVFFKIGFLEVLKTTSICIKFRKKPRTLPINDFIFMKVANIQVILLLKHFSFYYYHNWRCNNFHGPSYISL